MCLTNFEYKAHTYKRKGYRSGEFRLEKFVKSFQVNLFLAGFNEKFASKTSMAAWCTVAKTHAHTGIIY